MAVMRSRRRRGRRWWRISSEPPSTHQAVLYGLGVQSVEVDGHPTLGHSGRFLGARAAMRWLPDEQIAISVLTNQSRSDPNAVVKALLKVVLPPPTPAPTLAPSACPSCPPVP